MPKTKQSKKEKQKKSESKNKVIISKLEPESLVFESEPKIKVVASDEIEPKAKPKLKRVFSEESESKESKLIEEVEEQEPVSLSRFNQFIQRRPIAPVLEKISPPNSKNTSLESEIGFTPKEKTEEKEEKKYEETLKYDIGSEYNESLKKQREITPDMISQVSSVPQVDFQKVGRGRIMPGQEFHIRNPVEMPEMQSSEKYDVVSAKKSKKFQGETTQFQENLERRYDNLNR